MAHFWTYIKKDDFQGWALLPLDGFDEFVLTGDHDSPVQVRRHQKDHSRAVLLREKSGNGEDMFLLISKQEARQNIRINGEEMHAGIRLLKHRDEVVICSEGGGSTRHYFSTERKVEIDRFYDSDHDVSCLRCHQKLINGDKIVRCPACRAAHHQSDELNCWTYASTCGNGLCSQETDFETGFRWMPDYLIRRSGECLQ